jgi:hypothetical protein
MNLSEARQEAVNYEWIHLDPYKSLVKISCKQGNEPSSGIKEGNIWTSWDTISFSRRNLFCGGD